MKRITYLSLAFSLMGIALAIAATLLSACAPNPIAPGPTNNPLHQSPPPIIQSSPSPSTQPRPARSPSHKPVKVTPSYPVRAIHAGEGCHGFDKGHYAYDEQRHLLYCGPINADLPTWEPAP